MKTLKKSSSAGVFRFFGLPFLFAGLFFIYAGIEPSFKWQNDSRPPLFVLIPFCSVFVLMGLFIFAGVSGYELNQANKTIRTYWGLFFPLFRRSFSFSDLDSVLLSKEIRRSKNSTYYMYLVSVVPKGSKKPHKIDSWINENVAREFAEKISRILQIDLLVSHDVKNPLESTQRIEASKVDRSFAEKLSKIAVSRSVLPAQTNMTVMRTDSGQVISYNTSRIPMFGEILLISLAILFLLFLNSIYSDGVFHFPSPSAIPILSLLILFASGVVKSFKKFKITLLPGCAEVAESAFGIRTKKFRLKRDEIDELKLVTRVSPKLNTAKTIAPVLKTAIVAVINFDEHRIDGFSSDQEAEYVFNELLYYLGMQTASNLEAGA